MKAIVMCTALLAVTLAGCLGSDPETFDFEPGEYKETGNTVELNMWVEDLVGVEVFDGFEANLWAFCAEATTPGDTYSENAIEWHESSGEVYNADYSAINPESNGKCSVPGPTLRVTQGDNVIVNFVNNHFHAHTIHWHGQFVPWESDGVPGKTQDSVVQGDSFTYEFIAKRAGTLWYHCHVDTQFHVMQGLYGMMIVEPQDTTYEPKDIDNEYELVFSNLIRDLVENVPLAEGESFNPHAKHGHGGCISGMHGCQNPAIQPYDPDVFLLNGVSAPNTFARNDTLMLIDPGERLRIRMLNAGPSSIETIHLHGHDMLVTHKDGNPLPGPYWVDTIVIGPGERYDVVVEGREGNEGIWVMHTHRTDHVTNDGQYPGGMLTAIVYRGLEDNLQPFLGVEAAGGQPYEAPVPIPDDYSDSITFTHVTGLEQLQSAVNLQLGFPVEVGCVAKRITATIDARAVQPQFSGLISLKGTVTMEDGTFVGEATLVDVGNGVLRGVVTWTTPVANQLYLKNGNYTLSVNGDATEAEVELRVSVQYFDHVDSMRAAFTDYNNVNTKRLAYPTC